MSLGWDDIYNLLPAIYRTRDAANGGPLNALIGIIAQQAGVLDDNLQDLYADQFIETCASWTVPYIGDLVGWQGLFEGIPGTGGGRAEVANTIGYRRRKGTPIALEQIAHDVTGKQVCVVEFFRKLATTEYLNHLRIHHDGFVDLRRGSALEKLGGAFDTLNRTVDIRRIGPRIRSPNSPDTAPLDVILHGEGRFNIPDVGAYVWRWNAYPVANQPAYRLDGRRFLFSPLGNDMPLFSAVPPRDPFVSLTSRMDVPQPIGRREFHDNLHEVATGAANFYGSSTGGGSVLIAIDGTALGAGDICVCNLDDVSASAWALGTKGKVAIDPVLGRILIPPDRPEPAQVAVDYCYGFGKDMGGGPYSRIANVVLDPSTALDPNTALLAIVGAGRLNASGQPYALVDAVADFNALPPGSKALVVLANCDTYAANLTGARAIKLAPGGKLWIVSEAIAASGSRSPANSRATLTGDIEVVGLAAPAPNSTNAAPAAGQLIVSGVLMAGAIHVSGEPVSISLRDSTLVPGLGLTRSGLPKDPGAPSVVFDSAGSNLQIENSITGPLFMHAAANASIVSSIVDSTSRFGVAVAGPDGAGEGPSVQVANGTLIGKVRAHLLQASNSIFLAQRAARDSWAASVWCTRLQSGCVRYCFVPGDAIVPARYRCLPDGNATEQAVMPKFVSLQYGHPSYGLLSGDCPVAIWQGADDESEIGGFHDLYMPQAVNNLSVRLGEYLPIALEAGIFLIPSRSAFPGRPGKTYSYMTVRAGVDDDERHLLTLAVGVALI
jgi:hypothetical protein